MAALVMTMTQGSTDGTNFASLADLTVIERKLFYDAVSQVHAEAQVVGPYLFASPEAFPGFMKQLENLIELLKEEWSDALS